MSRPNPPVLFTASWLRLLSITHAHMAASIAGDRAEAERLRDEAHAVLDANLDQRAEAAAEVRALFETPR